MLHRIFRTMNLLKKNYINDMAFSFQLASSRFLETVAKRMRLIGFAKKQGRIRNTSIMKCLETILQDTIEQYRTCEQQGEKTGNAPIWVCWWSGIDDAPDLVKKCIESIKWAAGVHPVHIISQDNYQVYLHIPAFILNLVNNKSMCLANFSDYLRFSLLNKYGGMWIDALYTRLDYSKEEGAE